MKGILAYSILGLLLLPAIQQMTGLFPAKPLKGAFTTTDKQALKLKDWKSGTFQESYESFLSTHSGWRSIWIRIYNQMDFSLFSKVHAEGVVMGKDGQLFEEEYIRAYLGGDFIGTEALEKKLRRIRFLQEAFRKKGKDLILVLEPGKASFYPELIPDHWKKVYPHGISNYNTLVPLARNLGVQFLDFNTWFCKLKGNTPYPLYAETGIHWSSYGMSLAADSLVRFLEDLRSIDLPDFIIDRYIESDTTRDGDYDAADAMNLMFRLPHARLAYPEYHFENTKEKKRISVLTIADSYYWNIFNTRIPKNVFSNEAFWYFNAMVYPDTYYEEKLTSSLDILAETNKQDVIFLMVTERFLYKFDWGFIDQLYDALTPELEKDLPYLYEWKIRHYSDWFNQVIVKARKQHRNLSDVLSGEARYVLFNENNDKCMLFLGPAPFEDRIRGDENWMSAQRKRAQEEGISVDEQIRNDANQLFQQEFPDWCNRYQSIQAGIQKIKSDPQAMQKIRNNPYFLREEDMLFQVGWAMIKGTPHSLASIAW